MLGVIKSNFHCWVLMEVKEMALQIPLPGKGCSAVCLLASKRFEKHVIGSRMEFNIIGQSETR